LDNIVYLLLYVCIIPLEESSFLILMSRKITLICVLLCLFTSLSYGKVLAQFVDIPIEDPGKTTTESFLDSIKVDLPEAKLKCRAGGSLRQLFPGKIKLKARGNAFFVDTANKEIAFFERGKFKSSKDSDEDGTVNIFMKIKDVPRNDITNLLLKKSILVTKNVQVILVVRIPTDEGEDTFLFSNKEENGNFANSTLFTAVTKLGNITHNGEKFLTIDGLIKLRLAEPPKMVDSDGSLVDVLKSFPGTIVCRCKNCPVHDFDLTDLQEAFDGELVENILEEATSSSSD